MARGGGEQGTAEVGEHAAEPGGCVHAPGSLAQTPWAAARPRTRGLLALEEQVEGGAGAVPRLLHQAHHHLKVALLRRSARSRAQGLEGGCLLAAAQLRRPIAGDARPAAAWLRCRPARPRTALMHSWRSSLPQQPAPAPHPPTSMSKRNWRHSSAPTLCPSSATLRLAASASRLTFTTGVRQSSKPRPAAAQGGGGSSSGCGGWPLHTNLSTNRRQPGQQPVQGRLRSPPARPAPGNTVGTGLAQGPAHTHSPAAVHSA